MGGDCGPSRGFREVDITITSAQPGLERFPASGSDDPIYPAYWRNNLTSFSQYANLYFVAVCDQIHVYQPEFPSQKLQQKIFSWTVALNDGRRLGYIRPEHPHWINRLVVDDFGTEEVIATAHDDGDFIVCTVRSVCRAIKASQQMQIGSQDAASRFIRYMCRKNVELSAWGIAIHQNARLLAVSSNTKKITVLAPALISKSGSSHTSDFAARADDRAFLLAGHDANVPAIAFCNTSDDPEGRFLVSTDISGGIIVWDIWKQCGLKKIAMSVDPEDAHLLGENYLGWSVTCVDPRSFRSVRSDVEFVGFARTKKSSSTVDISPARKHLRDFQFWHESDPRLYRTHAASRRRGGQSNLHSDSDIHDDEDYDDDEDDGDADGEEEEDELEDDSEQGDDDLELDDGFEPLDNFEGLDAWHHGNPWDLNDTDQTAEEILDAIDFSPSPGSVPDISLEDVLDESGSVIDSASLLPTTNSLPPMSSMNLPAASHQPFTPQKRKAHGGRIPPPAPKAPEPKFPFSILHSGKRIVTLLRPPFDTAAAVCIDPCHEHLPPSVSNLGAFDRLKLSSYIPELGVIILATQKGRAAVFTLTSLPSTTIPNPTFTPHHSTGRQHPNYPAIELESARSCRYALRLDWVLPFKSQENAELRPWAPLLGVATSPVQGCYVQSVFRDSNSVTVGDSARGEINGARAVPARWRLFLTYADNTVLTYELFRNEERNDQLLMF